MDHEYPGQDRYEIRGGSVDKAEASGIELDEHPHQKKHVEIQEEEVDSHHPESSKRHSLGNLKKRIGSLRKKKD
jgi:hypothetical protein